MVSLDGHDIWLLAFSRSEGHFGEAPHIVTVEGKRALTLLCYKTLFWYNLGPGVRARAPTIPLLSLLYSEPQYSCGFS